MTDEEAESLGRRALAAGFEWRSGCVDTYGNVYQWRHENRQVEACAENSEGGTRGVLLEQVRERWGPALVTLYGDDSCQVLRDVPASERFPGGDLLCRLFADLVSALEGAPKP